VGTELCAPRSFVPLRTRVCCSHVFEDESGSEGSGDDGSIASFDDGYGSDMVGGEDDREYLEALPALQREQEIAQRHEARERGRELVAVRRKQQKQKQKPKQAASKAASSSKKRVPQNPWDSDEESESEEDRKKLRRRSSTKRRARDSDESSSDEELPEYATGAQSFDQDGSDSEFEGENAKKRRLKHKRSVLNNADLFDDVDEGDFAGDSDDGDHPRGVVRVSDRVLAEVEQREQEERAEPLTLEAVNAFRATRDFFINTFHEPWFKRAAKGLLVRVFVGTSSSGGEHYRLTRVSEVVRHGEQYTLIAPETGGGGGAAASSSSGGAKIKTNRCLVLYVAEKAEGKPFPISRVSNSPVTSEELEQFLMHIKQEGRDPPRPTRLRRKADEVRSLRERHTYTEAEVREILDKRLSAFNPAGVRNLSIARSATLRAMDTMRDALFESLRPLLTHKTALTVPTSAAEEEAAFQATMNGITDEESRAKALELRKQSHAQRKRYQDILAMIEREAEKRGAAEAKMDTTVHRNSSVNRRAEKLNDQRRRQALLVAQRAEKERLRAIAEADDPVAAAAPDPIKRRDAIPESIWKVKTEDQAKKDHEEWLKRKTSSGGAAGTGGEAKAAEPDKKGAGDKDRAAPALDVDLLTASTGSAKARARELTLTSAHTSAEADALLSRIVQPESRPSQSSSSPPTAKLSDLLKRRKQQAV
jgi:hypothetical protein